MQTVKVDKKELLAKLESNRLTHRATFEKAIERYREEFIKRLEQMLSEAKRGIRYRQQVGLIVPEDQSSDYDRAIMMVKMSVEDQVVLTETEFAQYVLDDWRWKHQWSNSTATYAAGSLPDPMYG